MLRVPQSFEPLLHSPLQHFFFVIFLFLCIVGISFALLMTEQFSLVASTAKLVPGVLACGNA
jgi:hypothetical protein